MSLVQDLFLALSVMFLPFLFIILIGLSLHAFVWVAELFVVIT